MCASMVDIQSATAEIRREKTKKKKETKGQKYNVCICKKFYFIEAVIFFYFTCADGLMLAISKWHLKSCVHGTVFKTIRDRTQRPRETCSQTWRAGIDGSQANCVR